MKKNLLFYLTCSLFILAPNNQLYSDRNDSTIYEASTVYPYAKVRPIEWTHVEITDGFWKTIRDRSKDIGVPDYLRKFEEHGYIDHFRYVANDTYKLPHWNFNVDEFVHKLLEAMGIYARESEKIAGLHRSLSQTIIAAQREDGYLNTFYLNPIVKKAGVRPFEKKSNVGKQRTDDGAIRLVEGGSLSGRFEFYIFAHFTQAAIENYRATGERKLLDAAIKFADLIVGLFADPNDLPYGTPARHKYIDHPNHELAMVELYRISGNKKYLAFVRQTLEQYEYFGPEFNSAYHHAVQEALFNAGATSLYLETGDEKIMEVVKRLWNDINEHKKYIIGGIGSSEHGEKVGSEYQLAHENAYCETCAAISMVFWNHTMLLATGEAKYADEMARSLYNNVLSGYSLDGTHYFYQNVLKWTPQSGKRTRHQTNPRSEFFGCSCCPPNVHRLLAGIGRYIYTHRDNRLQVNLFINSTVTYRFPGNKKMVLQQQSDYPWQGNIKLTVKQGKKINGAIEIRIPNWCENALLKVNGESQPSPQPGTYAVINRQWSQGDVIELSLPLLARVIDAHPKVEAQQGKIALMRGPLVYCIEQSGNRNIDLLNIQVCDGAEVNSKFEPDLLGGVMTLKVPAKENSKSIDIQAIPYYTWANREVAAMMVWLPVSPGNR